MTRVVIDTNVLVSGLHNEHGAEAAVLGLIGVGKLLWCVSAAILTEYKEILARPKFRYLDAPKVAAMLDLASSGQMTLVTSKLAVSEHEPDNRFLECAEVARADYLVTGNKRHFPKRWKRTRVVNARELREYLNL